MSSEYIVPEQRYHVYLYYTTPSEMALAPFSEHRIRRDLAWQQSPAKTCGALPVLQPTNFQGLARCGAVRFSVACTVRQSDSPGDSGPPSAKVTAKCKWLRPLPPDNRRFRFRNVSDREKMKSVPRIPGMLQLISYCLRVCIQYVIEETK